MQPAISELLIDLHIRTRNNSPRQVLHITLNRIQSENICTWHDLIRGLSHIFFFLQIPRLQCDTTPLVTLFHRQRICAASIGKGAERRYHVFLIVDAHFDYIVSFYRPEPRDLSWTYIHENNLYSNITTSTM